MNSKGLIPDLGAAGQYKLSSPFNASITENGVYTCVAIRTLREIEAGGQDAEGIYYTSPYNIPSAMYQADLEAGASIITLQNSAGELIHVPSTYIESYPKAGGIPYAVMGLAVNLGPLPTSMDLSVVKDSTIQLMKDKLGVTAVVQEALLSTVTQVSQEDDKSMTVARQVAMSVPETERARCMAAETALIACKQKISVLEAYILNVLSKQHPDTGGFTTPDFSLYASFLNSFKQGDSLDIAKATELAGYMQKLDQQTTSTLWNADPNATAYSLVGAFVIDNIYNEPDFPTAANFNRCLILQLAMTNQKPVGKLFLNYNYTPV